MYLKEPGKIIGASQTPQNDLTRDRTTNGHGQNQDPKTGETKLWLLLLVALAYDYIDLALEIIDVMIRGNMLSAEAGETLLTEVKSYARRRTVKVWLKLKQIPRMTKTFDIIHKDRNYRFRIK